MFLVNGVKVARLPFACSFLLWFDISIIFFLDKRYKHSIILLKASSLMCFITN